MYFEYFWQYHLCYRFDNFMRDYFFRTEIGPSNLVTSVTNGSFRKFQFGIFLEIRELTQDVLNTKQIFYH